MVANDRIDALESSPPGRPVQIELRIPGPWRGSGPLADALEEADTGYRFDEGHLVRESDGWRCEMGASPPDDEIAGLFAYDGRMSRSEIAAVAKHAAKVHLIGPGGSAAMARAMVDAATALVKIGASGVMVDNSSATHSPTDWLTLASDPKPGGLYWIFTVLSGGDDEVWTSGQHCLGLRDAELRDPPDEQFAYLLVHNFLGYVYQSGKTVHDGDVVDGPGGTIYRATQHPFTRVQQDTPFFNPFGVWRLERVNEDEKWSKDAYHPIR
ncbi:MAG TPA: DUF4261 domain-containing protein [Tepidisphaeraceae bacterium]|nr:DUF4261 domain-containing protein [Tepidisphaeraceae bacterium]